MWEEDFDTEHHGVGRKRDYSPVSWSEYFEMMDDVVVGSGENKDIFRVYKSGLDGPVLVLLHGGGHSALSWAVFTAAMTSRVTCRVLAMDLRGHGDTQVRNSDDLSTQTMSRDVANVVRTIYGEIPPPLILVGHNMGGAIAIHTATSNLIPSVVGLVVIDVVEGSAMDVLHSMQNFLRGRPKTFKSIDHAIEWSIKSGQIRNLESAKVSMVGQVRRCENVDMVPSEQPNPVNDVVAEGHEEFYDLNYVTDKAENARSEVSFSELECGAWVGEELGAIPQFVKARNGGLEVPECILIRSQPQRQSVYSWRIDLSKAEKYWDGWFRGISNLFLSCNVPKLLLLAGIDRLDRDLTIGQMQGKFMMQVLPPCGHAVHEDTPDKVAEALASFMIRQKFAEARSGNKSSSYPYMR